MSSDHRASVQADVRDPDGRLLPVLATSIDDHGTARANALLDRSVRILRHPRHPSVALLKVQPGRTPELGDH
ncbi:MAG: hypothetical protein IPM35_28780 [Myxococcales bacterium]|nr:hypothetical protein [Myxococcales bacterium]